MEWPASFLNSNLHWKIVDLILVIESMYVTIRMYLHGRIGEIFKRN